MKRLNYQKGISTIIAVIILAIILVAGGAYYFKQQQVKIASKSAAVDATASWKTYINTQYGFEIKYPNKWLTRENAAYLETTYSKDVILKICRSDSYANFANEMWNVKFESQNYPDDFGVMGYFPSNSPSGAILEITIECRKTIPQDKNLLLSESVDYESAEPQLIRKSYSSSHDGLYYSFNLKVFPQNITSQEKDKLVKDSSSIFNQMLSTFKFTQ